MIPEINHPGMGLDAFIGVILFATVVGIVISMFMMYLEDERGRAIFRKVRCKLGKHKHHIVVHGRKIAKMHCQDCKARRTDRNLRVM